MVGWRTLLVSALYLFGAVLGIHLAREAGNVAAIWPPNAILLAVLLCSSSKAWPKYLGACFLANIGANLLYGDAILVATGFASVNMLEVIIGAYLIRRKFDSPFRLEGLKALLFFCAHGAGVACIVGATMGAALVSLAYGADYWAVWPVWFVADAVGVLLFSPLVLAFMATKRRELKNPRNFVLSLAICAVTFAGSAALFAQESIKYIFIITPVLLLVALRFKLLGAAVTACIVAMIGVGFTVNKFGPFASSPSVSDNIFALQVFLLGAVFPLLALAALIQEQDNIKRRLLERQGILDRGARIAKLGYWTWDLESDRCTMVSDEMLHLLGLSNDQFHRFAASLETYAELLHPDDRDHYKKTIIDARRRGTTYKSDFRLADGSRSEQFLSEFGGYIGDEDGRISTAVGVVQDVTQQKAQEELLRQAKLKAEEADLAKGRFLAMISHEIRTPMNGVLGMVDLLLKTELTGPQRQFAGTAQDSARILLAIIDDLLDLSKLEAGCVELESIPYSMSRAVDHVIDLLRPKAQAKGLELKAELSDGLPPWLEGDPNRFSQILLNLVGNAIKFTPDGQILIKASSEMLQSGHHQIRFEVVDSGIGVTPEAQEKIFEHFSQADASTTRIYGGSGLGLAICKQLVDLMGGDLGVESAPGRGSTFWFTVSGRSAEEPQIESARRPDFHQAAPGRKLKVLVAEDNSTNQLLVRVLLELDGHEVELVANGAEAVEALATRQFDIVLMDDQMPHMSGVEATREIRALDGPSARVPIIALTANAMESDRRKYIEAGMDDHIAKPIEKEVLHEAIRRATA